jgi:subtilisin family serine protease
MGRTAHHTTRRGRYVPPLRAVSQASAAGAVVAILAAGAAPAQASHLGARAGVARPLVAVGYRTRAALRGLHVVRVLPGLHVAEVLGPVAGRPGITFVQRAAARHENVLREPALADALGKTIPWEWQWSVAREDAVPDTVLRAASAITIAIVDTGADLNAPDLRVKSPLTFNERTGTADVRDTVGHGTFVAALAAGSITNDDGIAGFGGDAKLLIVKAGSGDGSFTDLDEATAIAYAVDHGARIVNLSLGGSTTSTTERRAIDYATSRGVLVVAAAGNEYGAGDPVEYPAALLQPAGSNGVGGRGLSVGASTMTGARASFSNTGGYISLVAPGENVFSAVSADSAPGRFPRVALTGAQAGLYGYASGTSFSTPEVAGAAALVWAANPLLDAAGVTQILKETASGEGAWTPELGWGVLDVGAAVQRALGATAATAGASLTLNAQLLRPTQAVASAVHKASIVATLHPSAPGVDAASRHVTLERFDGLEWKPVAAAQTTADGQASWTLRFKPGDVELRARWAGSGDLLGAVSSAVHLHVV